MSVSVLLVTPGHRQSKVGGETMSTVRLAKCLASRSHRVYYMASYPPFGLLQELEGSGVYFLQGRVDGRNPIGIIKGSLDIRKAVVAKSIDVVHAQQVLPALMGYLAAKTSLLRKVAVIWHDRGIHTRSYPIIGRLFNHLMDFVITNSESEARRLNTYGLDPGKVKTIYNGIDLSQYSTEENQLSLRKELGLKDGLPVVGIVARLSEEKGHRHLLRAVPYVLGENPAVQFLMVGGGALEQELRQLAHALNIQGAITWAGIRSDVPRLLSTIDLLVLPSTHESFGNVLVEAGAMSKPVVASRVGGIPEIVVDGTTGILVPPKDVVALARAISYLLANPEVASRMGVAGRIRVEERFALSRTAAEVEQVYQRVLSRNAG
jgi:glycosyltransferase involved in cell wall biosynthesis